MKIFLFFLLLALFASPVQLQASTVLFEHRERTYLSRDVVYELNRKVTTAGFLDVHILRIPLNDPYITIAPVESHRELGRRETVFNLLTEAGAIAGTNADFFGMTGTHSLAFGPVIANNQLMSITESYNRNHNEFAAFFLDAGNIPMLRYIRPRIWFTINGIEVMRVNAINKVHAIDRPVIITRNGMTNTAPLNERFAGLTKVVVDNDYVVAITGLPVNVPENGFVIVMNSDHFNNYRPDFWFGQLAHYSVFSDLGHDLSQIQAAVGGGGLILQHGMIVNDGATAIPGRHPRTALGFTPDLQHLILMTVDGRGHSIGATHEEMAQLLLRHGATEAMHLDGGGSSTMVAQTGGRNSSLQVVNRVSDGSQRAVMNAIGVFDHSTPGAANQLVLQPYNRYIPHGSSIILSAYGLDLYRHRVWINPAEIIFSSYNIGADGQRHPSTGTWNGNVYTPDRPGPVYIRAQYGGIVTSKIYMVQDVVALRFSAGHILTSDQAAVPFSVNGITSGGSSSPIAPERGYVHFVVSPPEIGMVMDHVFIPNQPGEGQITAIMGSVSASIPVMVTAPGEYVDPMYFAAQHPSAPQFTDPIRTAMTTVTPGYSFDFDLTLPPSGSSITYSSRQAGSAAVIQISAANGGIFSTDRSQWGRFSTDINGMFPDFVIIQMDVNPRRMASVDERELFHHAMTAQQELGRTVFVVSNTENTPSVNIIDGIRYIDLGNAGESSTILFRIIERQIWYDF